MEAINGKNLGRQKQVYREQLVTIDDLETFRDDLLSKIKELMSGSSGMPGKKWLKSLEVRKLLGISPGTLQTLRVNGTLPFTKIGGTVYYDYEDIQKVLAQNRVHNNK